MSGVRNAARNIGIGAKLLLLFIIVPFVPRIFFLYAPETGELSGYGTEVCARNQFFKIGIEHIPEWLYKRLTTGNAGKPLRIGLITNQTGINQCGKRTLDILIDHGCIVSMLFSPEHGMRGLVRAQEAVHEKDDVRTGIPIVPLYNGSGGFKKLNTKEAEGCDVFIFDMQDAGMRHYTHSALLYFIMEHAVAVHKDIIVLDRPNPLGPLMEGPTGMPNDPKSIWKLPIPLRHGLTIGELARYLNYTVFNRKVRLTVVPMKGYRRNRAACQGVVTPLSPNLQTIPACQGYSFLGLLGEVRPFGVGIDTPQAFQVILLPESLKFPLYRWYELRVLLRHHGISSALYRHLNPRKGEWYAGLTIAIQEMNEFSGLKTLIALLKFFADAGVSLQFSSFFDQAVGTPLVQQYVRGDVPYDVLAQQLNEESLRFAGNVKSALLYEPAVQRVYF